MPATVAEYRSAASVLGRPINSRTRSFASENLVLVEGRLCSDDEHSQERNRRAVETSVILINDVEHASIGFDLLSLHLNPGAVCKKSAELEGPSFISRTVERRQYS